MGQPIDGNMGERLLVQDQPQQDPFEQRRQDSGLRMYRLFNRRSELAVITVAAVPLYLIAFIFLGIGSALTGNGRCFSSANKFFSRTFVILTDSYHIALTTAFRKSNSGQELGVCVIMLPLILVFAVIFLVRTNIAQVPVLNINRLSELSREMAIPNANDYEQWAGRLNLEGLTTGFSECSFPLPDQMPQVSFEEVKAILTDDRFGLTQDEKEQIGQFIKKIQARQPWLYVPHEEPARGQWFDNAETALKSIALKLRNSPTQSEESQSVEAVDSHLSEAPVAPSTAPLAPPSTLVEDVVHYEAALGIVHEIAAAHNWCGSRYQTLLSGTWSGLNGREHTTLASILTADIRSFALECLSKPLGGESGVHMRNRRLFALGEHLNLGPSFDENSIPNSYVDHYQYAGQFFALFDTESVIQRATIAMNGEGTNPPIVSKELTRDWLYDHVTVPQDWQPTLIRDKEDDEIVSYMGMSYTVSEVKEDMEDPATIKHVYVNEEILQERPLKDVTFDKAAVDAVLQGLNLLQP